MNEDIDTSVVSPVVLSKAPPSEDHGASDAEVVDESVSDKELLSASMIISIWRVLFLSIMVYEWHHTLPHYPLDLENKMVGGEASAGKDRWYGYDQFLWLQDLLPDTQDKVDQFKLLGYIPGVIAVVSPGIFWFLLPGTSEKFLKIVQHFIFYCCSGAFTILYAMRFFSLSTWFTNHNYLFFLLLVLTTFTGGGGHSLLGIFNVWKSRKTREKVESDDAVYRTYEASNTNRCEWAIVVIRAQMAVVYLFASLWKIHVDWFSGRIVQGIFISFEEQDVHRGVPWAALLKWWPNIFVAVAFFGWLLDFSMFLLLTFAKPKNSTIKAFAVSCLLFHSFTGFTMSQRIGYAFPGVCISSIVAFFPINDDANLVTWILRYELDERRSNNGCAGITEASNLQRRFTLVWIFIQLLLPLRTPIISKGEFPYTFRCYRYSWTMMMHSSSNFIIFPEPNPHPPITTLNLLPTCMGKGKLPNKYMPRKVYYPNSDGPGQNTYTLPTHLLLNAREHAIMESFVSYVPHVAGGMARMINKIVPKDVSCLKFGYDSHKIGIFASYHSKLNDIGAYHRLIDPSVDLAVIDKERIDALENLQLRLARTILDYPFDGTEWVLKGIGSMRNHALTLQPLLERRFPGNSVHLFADRSSCLADLPFWFETMNRPVRVVSLLTADERPLLIQADDKPITLFPSFSSKDDSIDVSEVLFASSSIMIGTDKKETDVPCIETEAEDMIFALVL